MRKVDFMTGSKLDADNAIAAIARTARTDVADLEVTATPEGPNRLTAKVLVKNKVGHRFPSGVGFRRAFVELAVVPPAGGGEPGQGVRGGRRADRLRAPRGPPRPPPP